MAVGLRDKPLPDKGEEEQPEKRATWPAAPGMDLPDTVRGAAQSTGAVVLGDVQRSTDHHAKVAMQHDMVHYLINQGANSQST